MKLLIIIFAIIIIGLVGLIFVIMVRYRHQNMMQYQKQIRDNKVKDSSKQHKITSRYIDTLKEQNIIINPKNIPENLRDLLPFAEKWAIGDDEERVYYEKSITLEEKKEFIDTVWPRMDEIEKWCTSQRDKIPVPDEVVLFDMMMESASEVYYGMGNK